jgi:hypothetical protein
MSVGSSPGSGNTGTMIRATFVELSRFNVSARPMFCNGGRLRLPTAVAERVG